MEEIESKAINIEGPPGESVFRHALSCCLGSEIQKELQTEIDKTLDHIAELNDDRLLVLVGALLVENAIDEFLAAFIPKYEALSRNLDFTLSLRIELARALQLCPSRLLACAHVIRKIRNDFVHNLTRTKFSTLSRDRLKSMHEHLAKFNPRFNSRENHAKAFKDLVAFLTLGIWIYQRHVLWLSKFIRNKEIHAPLKKFILKHES